jgi:hypothetical protein|tara:strand:+ start:928 stop:1761 length:834 start_codon:yes stop_codon:yes gene_type:complete
MAFLNWKIGFDTTSFNAGLKRMRASFNGWAKDAARGVGGQLAGGLALERIVTSVRDIYADAARIQREAFARGMSTDDFQRLEIAARRAGTEVDTLRDVMDDLSDKRFEAIEGSANYQGILQRYGLEFDDYANVSTQKLFEMFNEGVAEMGDLSDGQKAQLIRDLDEIGGDAGKSMAFAFSKGFFNNLNLIKPPLSQSQIGEYSEADRTYRDFMASLKTVSAATIGGLTSAAGWVGGNVYGRMNNERQMLETMAREKEIILLNKRMANSLETIRRGYE